MQISEIAVQIERFIEWLNEYGESSYDHQTCFAGPVGRTAKALYYSKPALGMIAVAPMIMIESYLPRGRVLFWKKQRFPIADAHYAMGFAYLYKQKGEQIYHDRAVHFLEVLKESRAPDYKHYCWGYPFDWVTRNGIIPRNTPLITTTPYAYEAFEAVYQVDHDRQWLEIMHSIAEHCAYDIKDLKVAEDCTTSQYFPGDHQGRVVNASAYRAALLFKAAVQFGDHQYRRIAEQNLNFVLRSQHEDGSWSYAEDGIRDFIDHYHTCFVIKALAKIEKLGCLGAFSHALDKGVGYYVANLFDSRGLPVPFAKAPRFTVYKRELYDYAECINLGSLLKSRYPALDQRMDSTIAEVNSTWQRRGGSFRTRRLHSGWDNLPMHRWGQSQMFRALCLTLLSERTGSSNTGERPM